MALERATLPVSAAAQQTCSWAGEMRYVTRQPILNLHGHVHGYELLFRDAPEAVLSPGANAAARTMLDNEVIFGLDWLTNGLPAFVRCTLESLTEDLVLVLEPEKTVLEIPAEIDATPRLLDCFRKLKARGFRLALDDFSWEAELRGLALLADYIRVDFRRFGLAERQYLWSLDCTALVMIAKNVDTPEAHKEARGEGFTLFQGSYFCHPVLLKKRKLPANRMTHFEIVQQLHREPINIREVSKLVLRDAALTYRMLRLVNSPIYAIRQEVASIEAAILVVGEDALRRIVSLAVLSELNAEEPPEILHMALVRARFCELSATMCGLNPEEQYLLGMFSLVPAMLRLPMEDITPWLPLRSSICEALQGAPNSERILLGWLELHERGDWEGCDQLVTAFQAGTEEDGTESKLGNKPESRPGDWPGSSEMGRELLSRNRMARNEMSQDQLMRNFAASAAWAAACLHASF